MRSGFPVAVLALTGCGGQHAPPSPEHDFWVATSTTGAPSPRTADAVVWTGTEMLVWGGGSVDDPVVEPRDDGALYSPDSDDWRPMATDGAPSERAGASVVWIGTRLFWWGGIPSGIGEGGPPSTPLADGGLYDPETDAWSTVAPAGAPSARFAAGAVWNGAEVILWGGEDVSLPDGQLVYLSTGARYDPAFDRWQPISDLGSPIANAAVFVAWTGNRLLVFDYFAEGPDRDGGLYDPSSDSWTPMTGVDMPEGQLCSPVWAGGQLLVFSRDESTVARYDPARDEWTRFPIAVSLCDVPRPIWTGRSVLYWAPRQHQTGPRVRFDPATNELREMSSLNEPTARTGASSIWTGSEMIVWGGNEDTGPYTNTGARYTP